MSEVAEILKNCAQYLEQDRAEMINILRDFATRELSQNQLMACFEIFHMQDYSMNYNTYFKKKNTDGKNVLEVVWTSHTGSEPKSILPKLHVYIENKFIETELSEADGIQFTRDHEHQLWEWFKSCWNAAGGINSKIPTYYCFDKEYLCRDIQTNELMEDNEAAKRNGYLVEAENF